MVLLTSSAVSAIISGGVICTFTFLLFLSGYVLQQQTVRSLQDALRNPPERLSVPVPILPPEFQNSYDSDLGNGSTQNLENQFVLSEVELKTMQKGMESERRMYDLWQEYIHEFSTDNRNGDGYPSTHDKDINPQSSKLISTRESLAYIFSLPDIGSLCSAVMFTQRHREMTRLLKKPQIVFVYPATWDISDQEVHQSAMDVLREMQDNFNVVLHPVTINRVWAGISIEQQLLAELQRYRWAYERAMYLGSPGISVNTSKLDEALAVSDHKSTWTLLHPHPKSHEASNPSLLLWVAGRGLLYPQYEMTTLVSHTSTPAVGKRKKQPIIGIEARDTAYVLFNEKEFDHRSNSKALSSGLFKQFDQERRNACSGFGLYND